jgi:glycogen debranching enzyme
MPKSIRITRLALAAIVPVCSAAASAQPLAPTPHFKPIQPIAFDTSGPVIRAHAEALKPFTVAGESGVILGQQDGTFEAWLLPVKVLSHLSIEATVEGYSVPIDVNQQSAEIEVHPDRTIVTYAHIAFTVRQIMFSPEGGPAGTGPVVLFQFDCLHPTEFTFRFTPNLEFMWPMRNQGHPGPEWISGAEDGKEQPGGMNGYYVLHADYPDLAAAITIPDARSGILAPYQERPQVHPVELKLRIDPATDNGKIYPLLMAVGTNRGAADSKALGATLERLNESIAALYQSHAESYKKLIANSVSIDTPDKNLNEAFEWAVVSIEQLKAKPWVGSEARATQGSVAASSEETGLVAGYYASGDSARPGFGWFFGRDALYTLYAVNGYGDFSLSRSELEFLIHRQRADGKIMHEYSQTAPAIDWQQFPYMYAAADSTPLFLLAMLDYVSASGDVDFLKTNRDAIEKAWAFETGHADTNGIYDNRQGTGWVESWPGGMPHQEIYLALLDQQASAAMGQIEFMLGDNSKMHEANRRAEDIAAAVNREFYDKEKGCYAFSRNADGSLDRTTTVYPALAWWAGALNPAQTLYTVDRPHEIPARESILDHPEACLQQLAGHALNTDWGLRDVSNEEKIYDGMSYHQGSVWPLFTGWAAMAEYRGNQPLAGYQMLMENVNLTKAQDLGAVTELLSGDFNVPFGRSTSHQLWSSAMVITPILRGLFGINIDATTKTITVNPHLPAGWNHADVLHLPVKGGDLDLTFNKYADHWEVFLGGSSVSAWRIRTDSPGTSTNTRVPGVRVPIPPMQLDESADIPQPGSRTVHARVLHEAWRANSATLVFEGLAGSTAFYDLVGIDHVPHLKVDSPGNTRIPPLDFEHLTAYAQPCKAPCGTTDLGLHFPEGEGWKTITVTLTW